MEVFRFLSERERIEPAIARKGPIEPRRSVGERERDLRRGEEDASFIHRQSSAIRETRDALRFAIRFVHRRTASGSARTFAPVGFFAARAGGFADVLRGTARGFVVVLVVVLFIVVARA